MTRLSVVIPVWNERDLALRCVGSVVTALEGVCDGVLGSGELIVVDDGSTDGVGAAIAEAFPSARVLRDDTNRGFAVAANRGLAAARGEFLLLLNSDTLLEVAALRTMLESLEAHPNLAGVAPRLVAENGSTQRSCMAFPRALTPLYFGSPLERWWPASPELVRYFLRDFDYEREQAVEQPPAACWLLRRSSWEAVGPFDEALELFFNDVDWCRRLAGLGGELRYLPAARVVHLGGASTRWREDFVPRWQTDRLRYQRKHHGRLGGLVVKACVSWTFLDWTLQNACRRLAGRPSEDGAPLRRAFASFLRS
jgi:N-acetylglucosaminyl-diphospho-decaprenol L-rhamnosyltransferase